MNRRRHDIQSRIKSSRLISSVIMTLMTINVVAMADPAAPKLVVGIVVDQLRTDYLEYLRGHFSEKGFNRLINNGLYLRDVNFRALVKDAPTATALIYTGSYPALNGIPAAELFDNTTRRAVPVLNDPTTIGNFTNRTLSPANMRLSTISDEIAVDGLGLGLIYAVGTDPQQSVIMASHAGNCALWLDDNKGNWCSTTYYRDFPQQIITGRNHRKPLSQRLDTIVWKPSLPLDKYPGYAASRRSYPFSYTFSRSDRSAYSRFANSAPGNAEVTDVAIDLIDNLHLGSRGDAVDMINVAYTAAPFNDVKGDDNRLELEDTYLRLDAQIARLLETIDKKAGLQNTLVFLTSTGYYNDKAVDNAKYRIPTGDISLRRMESLLNSFLSAKYGNGDYVDGIHNSQVYLNHKTIEQKNLDTDKVRAEARSFVVRMSGVSTALTISEILGENGSGASFGSQALALTIDPKSAGDIYLTFDAGWNVVDDITFPTKKYPVRESAIPAPAIIFAPGIQKREIEETIDATAIAPTVTSILRIRSPNGAKDKPLKY